MPVRCASVVGSTGRRRGRSWSVLTVQRSKPHGPTEPATCREAGAATRATTAAVTATSTTKSTRRLGLGRIETRLGGSSADRGYGPGVTVVTVRVYRRRSAQGSLGIGPQRPYAARRGG